jgi:hypothetical protein
MNPTPQAPDDLESLFANTRAEPSAISMQRMLARCREIPRAPARSKLRNPWALSFLVIAGLMTTRMVGERAVEDAVASAEPIRVEANTPPVASVELVERSAAKVDGTERSSKGDASEPWATYGSEPDVFDDLAFDPGNLAGGDLEAWIAAASESIDDG